MFVSETSRTATQRCYAYVYCCCDVDADTAVSGVFDEQKPASVVDLATSLRPRDASSPLNLRHQRVTSSSTSRSPSRCSSVVVAHRRDDDIGHVTVKEGTPR